MTATTTTPATRTAAVNTPATVATLLERAGRNALAAAAAMRDGSPEGLRGAWDLLDGTGRAMDALCDGAAGVQALLADALALEGRELAELDGKPAPAPVAQPKPQTPKAQPATGSQVAAAVLAAVRPQGAVQLPAAPAPKATPAEQAVAVPAVKGGLLALDDGLLGRSSLATLANWCREHGIREPIGAGASTLRRVLATARNAKAATAATAGVKGADPVAQPKPATPAAPKAEQPKPQTPAPTVHAPTTSPTNTAPRTPVAVPLCRGTRTDGKPCGGRAMPLNGYCVHHQPQAAQGNKPSTLAARTQDAAVKAAEQTVATAAQKPAPTAKLAPAPAPKAAPVAALHVKDGDTYRPATQVEVCRYLLANGFALTLNGCPVEL